MKGRKLALVVLSTAEKTLVLPNASRILLALNNAEPGTFTFVDLGH